MPEPMDQSRYEVAGMRRGWVENLLAIAEQEPPERQRGFLDALYALRNNFLPPAFVRSPEVKRLQDGINLVIALVAARVEGPGRSGHLEG